MTMVAHRSSTSEIQWYIDTLKRGEKPPQHPDVPEWELLLKQIDRSYVKAAGNMALFERALQGLARTDTRLAELLTPTSQPLAPLQEPDIEVVSSSEIGCPPLPAGVQLPDELRCGASPNLDLFCSYSRQVAPEAYDDYHASNFFAMLSMIAARRVNIPFQTPLYTNLMVSLVGRSGFYTKTTSVHAVKDVLESANLDFLLGADKTTPQKLLSDMSGKWLPSDYDDMSDEDQFNWKNRLVMPAQRGWIYNEFGKFVKGMLRQNSMMAEFAELFLQFDDCEKRLRPSTIKRGDELIENPYLALLGTMTPASIATSAKSGNEFWGDGFWARFAFVCPPPDEYRDVPWSLGTVAIPQKLLSSLKSWHQRLGVPDISIETIVDEKTGKPTGRHMITRSALPEISVLFGVGVHEAWVGYRSALKSMPKYWRGEDLDASYVRLPTMAIRAAAVIASLENNNRIEMRHWALAQSIAETWRVSLHRLYSQVNTPPVSASVQVEDEIIRHMRRLAERGIEWVSANDIQGSYMKSCSRKEVEDRLRGLKAAGSVQAQKTSHTVKYCLVGDEE